MPLTELNHYFIRANNLEETKKFYCDVLGFEVMPRPTFPFPGYWLGVNGKIQVHMKAAILHRADDLRVQAWARPDPGPGEVLLKVEVASICGTDVKVLHRTLQGQPAGEFVMGHEYAGTVAALGPGVDEFRVGDRVAVEVHKGCDRCENCIKGWYTSCLNYGDVTKGHRAKGLTCDGGFAEFAVNHINTLYRLPENLSFEQACMRVPSPRRC